VSPSGLCRPSSERTRLGFGLSGPFRFALTRVCAVSLLLYRLYERFICVLMEEYLYIPESKSTLASVNFGPVANIEWFDLDNRDAWED
jgi:hypothetical protein